MSVQVNTEQDIPCQERSSAYLDPQVVAFFHDKNVLITGGLGFIGSECVRLVEQTTQAKKVIVLDSVTYAATDHERFQNPHMGKSPYTTLYTYDIADIERCKFVMDLEKVDIVLHFAAETHVDRSIEDGMIFAKTNALGTQSLLEAARDHWNRIEDGERKKAFRFVLVSTDEVYGSLPKDATEGFTEESPINPRNPYSASKAAAEMFAQAAYATHGLPVVTTRSCNNYGPRQFKDKLIPKFIEKFQRGLKMTVYGRGDQMRQWVHTRDHSTAILYVAALGELGSVYNVGGEEFENRTLLHTLTQACEATFPEEAKRTWSHLSQESGSSADEMSPLDYCLEEVTDRPGHDVRYKVEDDRLKSLGWNRQFSLGKSLSTLVAHYWEGSSARE